MLKATIFCTQTAERAGSAASRSADCVQEVGRSAHLDRRSDEAGHLDWVDAAKDFRDVQELRGHRVAENSGHLLALAGDDALPPKQAEGLLLGLPDEVGAELEGIEGHP